MIVISTKHIRCSIKFCKGEVIFNPGIRNTTFFFPIYNSHLEINDEFIKDRFSNDKCFRKYFIKVINCRAVTCYNNCGLQFHIYSASFYSFCHHSDANYDRGLLGVRAKYLVSRTEIYKPLRSQSVQKRQGKKFC